MEVQVADCGPAEEFSKIAEEVDDKASFWGSHRLFNVYVLFSIFISVILSNCYTYIAYYHSVTYA